MHSKLQIALQNGKQAKRTKYMKYFISLEK